jgi:hypothetical protein
VYLNQKQNSKTAIAKYKENKNKIFWQIIVVNTAAFNSKHSTQFVVVMHTSERIMSQPLETTTIQEDLFSDFQGQIKKA